MNSENEELDYTPDLITLLDEDDKEHEFEVIDALDYNDEHYMALVPYAPDPAESLEQDAELIIMRVDVDEQDEEYLSIVEDDEELYNVSKLFEERLRDIFDIDI